MKVDGWSGTGGVSVAQAARDLDVHENVLRKWVKEFSADPVQVFPGQGQMKPEQLEIERLRREVAKLKAERERERRERMEAARRKAESRNAFAASPEASETGSTSPS